MGEDYGSKIGGSEKGYGRDAGDGSVVEAGEFLSSFLLFLAKSEDANLVYREVMDVAGDSGQRGNNEARYEWNHCMGLGWSFFFFLFSYVFLSCIV